MDFQAILGNKLFAGVLAGVTSAAVVDFAAFKSWKSWQEATEYNWSVAAWRWFQGAVGGLLAAAGLDAIV